MDSLRFFLNLNWILLAEAAIIVVIWIVAWLLHQCWSSFVASLLAGIGLTSMNFMLQGPGTLLNGFDTCSLFSLFPITHLSCSAAARAMLILRGVTMTGFADCPQL